GKEPVKTASESMVFNRKVFLERMMGDEEFAHDVAAGFLEELPTMLGALKEQINRRDCESIWKHAHKLKGSAANVGGEALRDLALEVEQAGKAGDLTEVARWIPELETQVARLSEALRQWEN
ncbi:MAG: Hpt domain-containing protein, partial [Terracidiphilus sp.]